MEETLLKIMSKCPLIEEELERVKREMLKPGKSPSEIEELKAFVTVYTTFLDVYKPLGVNNSYEIPDECLKILDELNSSKQTVSNE